MLLKKHMKLIKKAYEMNLKNAVQDIINEYDRRMEVALYFYKT